MEKNKTIQDLIDQAGQVDNVKVEFENPIDPKMIAQAILNYVDDQERI